jgi:hypothetical protein
MECSISKDRSIVDPPSQPPELLGTICSRLSNNNIRSAAHNAPKSTRGGMSVAPLQHRRVAFDYNDARAVMKQALDDRPTHAAPATCDDE